MSSNSESDEAPIKGRSGTQSVILWIAQGFGVGRIPVAPGTFGSAVGLLWFALLLVPGNLWAFLGGIAIGFALSVWLCGEAEKILGQTDPGSVVLDEIAAVPLCFLPWVMREWSRLKAMPPADYFFSDKTWLTTLTLFVLFRGFDVIKPWPVRQSQRLPGGWGVTVDDFLAATYVALASLLFVL